MKPIVFRVILVSLGLLLGLISAEVLMRSTLDFFECDPVLGWKFSAGARGLKVGRQGSFVQPVAINAHGFRDLERDYETRNGAVRIAMLGDSIVAALQVPQARRFSTLLEARANRSGARPLEVLNFGVDGYGTAQELLLFEEEVKRYAPDLVLQFVFPFNDLRDILPEAGGGNHYLAARCGRPYFALEGEEVRPLGKPVGATSGGLDGLLRKVSLLYGNLVRPGTPEGAPSVLRASDVYDPDDPSARRKAFRLAVGLIAELKRASAETGAGFGVVLVPDRRQAGQSASRRSAEELASPTREFARRLAARNIPHLDLLPVVRGHVAQGGRAYLEHDPHFDEEGHRVIAEVLHDWLAKSCREGVYSARLCAGAGLERIP